MKKFLSVIFAVIMICACLNVPIISNAASYTSDYKNWSQGASDNEKMRLYGCWVVSQAKLIAETGINNSSSFNPDVYMNWQFANGYLDSGFYQTNGGYAPVAYAQSLGNYNLEYLGVTTSGITSKIWENINNGYYSIIKVIPSSGGTHYCMIANSLSSANGTLYMYDTWSKSSNYGPRKMTYSTITAVYSYSYKSVEPSPTIYYSSIPEGEYKLQNANGKYLGVDAGGNKNGNVHAVNGDGSAEQNFRIKNTEIGNQYYIKNLANASQFCVNAYTPTNSLSSQSDVRLWDENTSNSKYWGFEDAGGGYYYIRCMMNPQFVLTADGYNYPENVTVLPFDGRDTQKWKLVDNSIKKPTWASIHASRTEMNVGESIYFEFNSDTADSYTIGIDRNDERILTQGFGSGKSFTYTCDQPGKYSAYVSASNLAGGVDSYRVYWTVYESEIYGDADQNGVLDITDAYYVLNQTGYNTECDFNENGFVDHMDARIVYRETVDPRILTESPVVDFDSPVRPSMWIGEVASDNPDQIHVLVYIDNDFGTESGFVNIMYDSSVLAYAGYSSLIDDSTAIMTVNDVTDESVNFAFAFLNHADNNNNLAIILFDIIDDKETALVSNAQFRTVACTMLSDHAINVNIQSHEHNFIEKDRVEATCSASGYIYYECECFECYIEHIPMPGHTPGSWEVVVEAQVGVEGKEQQKCTVCGEVLDERSIPALPDDTFLPGDVNGDANGDGKITAADARIVLRISAQLEKVENYSQPFAVFDVTGDGKITAADARKVLRISAQIES